MKFVIKKFARKISILIVLFVRKISGFKATGAIYVVSHENDIQDERWREGVLLRINFYAQKIELRDRVHFVSRLPLLCAMAGDPVLVFGGLSNWKIFFLKLLDCIFFVGSKNYISGWDWVYFSNFYTKHRVNLINSMANFNKAISNVESRSECAYVFGTGPSLGAIGGMSFDDGVRIVCNTIVKDKNLFDNLRPDFIVAGDAIYHYSHTEHARAFRQDLRRRMQESAVYFVYPEVFDVIVRKELADFSERLVPIPSGSHKSVHLGLTRVFKLPNLGNVLPLLQLPLACTVSKKICLWGYDGKAPNDRLNAFWANSHSHSYQNLMPELKLEFPYFYEHYVSGNDSRKYIETVHGDVLEKCLSDAELVGYKFEMLHPTWTETLSRRYLGKGGT